MHVSAAATLSRKPSAKMNPKLIGTRPGLLCSGLAGRTYTQGVYTPSLAGSPQPLGPSPQKEGKPGVNFAIFCEHATSVVLLLWNADGSNERKFELNPDVNRTNGVWHITLEGVPRAGLLYGYRVNGEGGWETGARWAPDRSLLDPYAPHVAGRSTFGIRDAFENFQEKARPCGVCMVGVPYCY